MEKTTETLHVEGMSCGHCVTAVREALSSVEGALVQRVEVGEATVTYDAREGAREALATALEDAGYRLAA